MFLADLVEAMESPGLWVILRADEKPRGEGNRKGLRQILVLKFFLKPPALSPVGVQDTEGGLYMTFSFRWVPEQILLPVTQEALILDMKRSCQVARGVQSQAAS